MTDNINLTELQNNYATLLRRELQQQQSVTRGKLRQTSKYGCTVVKAFKMWNLMPSTRGNRQQGRLMHDTESQTGKGKDRKSQETGEAEIEFHSACLSV